MPFREKSIAVRDRLSPGGDRPKGGVNRPAVRDEAVLVEQDRMQAWRNDNRHRNGERPVSPIPKYA